MSRHRRIIGQHTKISITDTQTRWSWFCSLRFQLVTVLFQSEERGWQQPGTCHFKIWFLPQIKALSIHFNNLFKWIQANLFPQFTELCETLLLQYASWMACWCSGVIIIRSSEGLLFPLRMEARMADVPLCRFPFSPDSALVLSTCSWSSTPSVPAPGGGKPRDALLLALTGSTELMARLLEISQTGT